MPLKEIRAVKIVIYVVKENGPSVTDIHSMSFKRII